MTSFLDGRQQPDWLGIRWPFPPSQDEPVMTTSGWIQHVLLFTTKSGLEKHTESRKVVRAIRDASRYWVGQFFGEHKPIKCFTEACGVLLAVTFSGLPFEARSVFMGNAFTEMIFFSEYNDPSRGPGEHAWHKTCIFVHRTWREILHVAFCVLIHRAIHRRTQQALRDCAHFYDNAVRICQEGEARPFRFYWRAFEAVRMQDRSVQEATTRLLRLVDQFAENEGGRRHQCNRMPLYWRFGKYQEP